ncbi:aromatic amino acid hydroxylase [Acanthopleuribacter pedis]|uniref:Aromatic amino acid hydroxylase n=1 Tax=Acanthopleuribacter pedis TaxID=442870 RepID=A0A8J7U298_9BACT|nr:aromatic amino acid hydroxylase [Acanthopleuribacter pedis]MBO1318377.1 aromatic amino acid hydroxylase [Acanthopleuribacter pedis]
MNAHETLDRIPAHLRRYVVHQDYDAYDTVDQAVWRFILLQTYNQLKETAHPIYVDGLQQTGISIDRIPRIEEMDACLSRFGWGAVCVDGFIPPRAFQEFQALGILTIAADIRTADHLAYTPAPDIIHESAGHAPIIPDPDYNRFLRRFGEIGKLAFSSGEDLDVYNAIRNLSVVKEDISSTPEQVYAAEVRLEEAIAAVSFTSEASFLSRLHWWTVEYGLIGKPEDYKIYGAGILSSVGESYFLHLPEVKKLPLTAGCIDVNYDITKQQPQLFVVETFDQLNHILDEVCETFAFKVGGRKALDVMLKSCEVGTVTLNSGLQITGTLTNIHGGSNADYLQFTGPCALSVGNRQLEGHGKEHHAEGYGSPLGVLDDGESLAAKRPADLERYGFAGNGSRGQLRFKSGVVVAGVLQKTLVNEDGRLMLVTFTDCRVTLGDQVLFQPEWGVYDMAVGDQVTTAFAGAADDCYWPKSDYSEKRVPGLKNYSETDCRLLGLYDEVNQVRQGEPARMLERFTHADRVIREQYPDHWLLPWYMLESLVAQDRGVALALRLRNFMKQIENRRFREVPVSMGLRFLDLS